MLLATWQVLLELAPWLLIGTAVSAALHVFLPPGLLQRQLRGPPGVFKAVALGVPLPLCSCGVIPAGLGLKRDGASDGASVGFLISTPQTGVDSALVAASFLGWPFALFKIGAAALTGLVGGLLVEFTGDRATIAPFSPPTTRVRTWRDGWEHGIELLQVIWRWLVFGVVASALLTTYIPAGSIAESAFGSGPLAVLAVLALSVPLYVCATASVPIAAGLVAAGLPTGAALVFLMAGPATNVATIGAVHRGFGRRVLAIYLGTVILGSAGLGLAFDAVWGATAVAATEHVHTSIGAQLSAVVLVLILAAFAFEDVRAALRRRARPTTSPALSITVEGMTCGGCANKLDGYLRNVEGVTHVEIDHEAGTATVHGTSGRERLFVAVQDAGFTPTGVTA
jgi:uncharacterized protein